jgi:hypothetical protein
MNTRGALIRPIRNTAAKKGMKQLGEQQAPFVYLLFRYNLKTNENRLITYQFF